MVATLQTTKIAHNNGTEALTINTDGSIVPTKAGSVLQIQKSGTRSTNSDTTSTAYAEVSSDYRLAFTPITANSYLQLNFYLHGGVGGNTRMGVRFYVSSNSDYSSATAVTSGSFDETFRTANYSTSSTFYQRLVQSEIYSAHTSTDTLYFTPYFNRGAGSNTARINDNGGFSYVTITEIAT